MNNRRFITITMAVILAFLIAISMACGNSEGDGPSLQNIPLYPDATEGESMEGTTPGGFIGGSLAQFTTTDSFDEVVDFYKAELNTYGPKILTQPSELGRQVAISVPKKKGMISVTIQEFNEEGTVNITFMEVGS